MTDYEDRIKRYQIREGDTFFTKVSKGMMIVALAAEHGKIDEEARKQIKIDEAVQCLRPTE